MSPTPALKLRLARCLKPNPAGSGSIVEHADHRSSLPSKSRRKISIGSAMDISPFPLPQDPEEKEGVNLLLDLSNLVRNEMAANSECLVEEEQQEENAPIHLHDYLTSINRATATSSPPSFLVHKDDAYSWGRARAVSFDHSPRNPGASVVTPVSSKRTARKAALNLHKAKKERIKLPNFPHLPRQQQLEQQQKAAESVHEHKLRALQVSDKKGIPITTIYRKKFSWKNYPGMFYFC